MGEFWQEVAADWLRPKQQSVGVADGTGTVPDFMQKLNHINKSSNQNVHLLTLVNPGGLMMPI